MTTEYFEKEIEFLKEVNKLPEDFEITEMRYRAGEKNFLWVAIGYFQRMERRRVITSEDKNKNLKWLVRHVYKWEYLFGTMSCRESYWGEDEEEGCVHAVRWNETTDKPEIVDVFGDYVGRPDLDIREP